MANEHPFQVLFETLGRVPTAHAESVNRQAYEVLSAILTVPVESTGRCILLRAPRAGHGKTHLLSRIQHQLGASHEIISLQSALGCRIDAASVTDDVLRRLVRQLPASGGLTVLDLVTRRLFASALQPLVASGEVPCQDREGALTALHTRPIETFDFNHPNAVTAHWARENFEVLGQRLSLEMAQRNRLPVSGVSFWVDALFQFASAPLESSHRVRELLASVHAGTGMEMERLEALLGLVTSLVRVVLVADDLEGFSTDETAALKLAAFLGSLRQSVERLDVILSLNQDVWQNAFIPRLSGGLADRLSEVVIELEPLTEADMEALLNSRVPGLGRRILDRMDVAAAGTHARGVIRAAGVAWLKAAATDSTSPAILAAPIAAPAATVQPSPPPMPEPEPATAPSISNDSASVSLAEPTVDWPAPVFTPPAAQQAAPDSAFQDAASVSISEPFSATSPVFDWQEPSQGFTPDSPVDEWTPAKQVVPSSPAIENPVDSPFQVSARPTTPDLSTTADITDERRQAPHEAFIVPVAEYAATSPPASPPPHRPTPEWQEPPQAQGIFAPPPSPALATTPPPYSPVSEPIFDAQPKPPSPPPESTDRVDDLLRQFRERYGRGSL